MSDVLGQLGRGLNIDAYGACILFHFDDLAEPIHMPADQVATQTGGGCERLFQIDLAAHADLLQGRQ